MEFSKEFYDQGWPVWDDMKVYGPTARHTRRLIFKMLKGMRVASVLDAGCGTGVLLYEISRRFPHARVAGSEYSEQGVEAAKKRLANAEFFILDLAFQRLDRKFDLVTCIDVLEHIEDDRAALKNLFAMTGKYLLLSVPLGPLFKVEQERMGHVHGYHRGEVEGKLREAGFEIVKTVRWGFPLYNIHRRIVNHMPVGATIGAYSARKKLISDLLYRLFFISVPWGGERYYALCKVVIPGDARGNP